MKLSEIEERHLSVLSTTQLSTPPPTDSKLCFCPMLSVSVRVESIIVVTHSVSP